MRNFQYFNITGLTCKSCVKEVLTVLKHNKKISHVEVDLKLGELRVSSTIELSIVELQKNLSPKYKILKKEHKIKTSIDNSFVFKLKQLYPLILVLSYVFLASVLINYNNLSGKGFMLDFMGLFFIVFSFFKLLDLKGFTNSFKMYDPIAKKSIIYRWTYPFIELIIGILFLMRLNIQFALIMTLIVLSVTNFGVIKVLYNKKSIKCACLGTALNLPMTEATLIENSIMIIMSILILSN